MAIGLLAITGVAVWGYLGKSGDRERRANNGRRQASSSKTTSPEEDRPGFSLTGADCLLVVEADDLFTPAVIDAVRTMVDDIEDLESVSNVVWLDKVPILNVFGLPDPLLPARGSSKQRLQLARDRALKHPLVAGQLLSDDGNSLQMPITFD